MKFEGAPHCSGLRRGLHPRESITVSNAPPALHVDLRGSPGSEGWRPYTGIEHRATESQAGVASGKPTRRPMKDVRPGPSPREVQFPFPGEDSSSGEFEEAVAWMRDRLDRLVSNSPSEAATSDFGKSMNSKRAGVRPDHDGPEGIMPPRCCWRLRRRTCRARHPFECGRIRAMA